MRRLPGVPDEDLADCDGGLCCPDDPLDLVLRFFPSPAAEDGLLEALGIGAEPTGAPLGTAPGGGGELEMCGLSSAVLELPENSDVDTFFADGGGGGGGEPNVRNNMPCDAGVTPAAAPAGGVHACGALDGIVSSDAPPLSAHAPLLARPLPAPLAYSGCLPWTTPQIDLPAHAPPPPSARPLLAPCTSFGSLPWTTPVTDLPAHARPLPAPRTSSDSLPPTTPKTELPARAPPSPMLMPALSTSSGSLPRTTPETESPASAPTPQAWPVPRKRRYRPVTRRRGPWSMDSPLHAVPATPQDVPSDNNPIDANNNGDNASGGGGARRRRPVRRPRNSQDERECSHCHSMGTPQWRVGPDGPGTLCNACGIRYATKRLLPEYRPSTAPSFRSDQHSNRHRKVVKLREQKAKENIMKAMVDSMPAAPKSDEFMDVCTYISTGL